MNALADAFQARRYSQFGEDGVLTWLFHGRRDGFYVDVGCHHPFRFSNTAVLHVEQGWTGINIDVDERATALFRAARPNDINVTMGVAREAGRRTVTIFNEGAINSFDQEAAAHPAWAHIPRETREVEVRPLGALLHELLPAGRAITLLNVDAEGLDFEILASNDWRAFRPEAITVEAHGFDPNRPDASETFRFLRDKGYRLVSHVAVTSVYQLAAGAADAPLTDEEVRWLYRCLLGREPESLATIAWFKGEQVTFERGRQYLRRSEEFRLNLPVQNSCQYYIPERFPLPFARSGKKLGLAVIVKDEAAYIENMLRSCAALIDHAVVVDTGSSDDTLRIVRAVLEELRIPGTVAEVPFEDFAQARNAALERVPREMDWILMLDADEEIVSADHWRFAGLLDADPSVDGWQLPRMNFADAGKRKPLVPYPDYQRRLFRNKPADPVRFGGRVHEVPANVARWGCAPVNRCETGEIGGPHIHHLGYMDITQAAWQKKHDFYTRLAGKQAAAGAR